MLSYDEHTLVAGLRRASTPYRVAFAAACAERLMPAYARYADVTGRGDPSRLRSILDRLWADVGGDAMADDELQRCIDACLSLSPQEDDAPWVREQSYAEDAAAALAYSLRCRRSGSTQDAAWAARRAFEALENHVGSVEPTDASPPGAGDRVMAHPLMQAELARLQRDLDDLLSGRLAPARLRDRARTESAEMFGSPGRGAGRGS